MRSFLTPLSVAAVVVSALSVPAHASGAPPGVGLTCGFTSVRNPVASDRQVLEIDGGPVVVADGTDPRAGRITCSIRLNGSTHATGTVGVTASSPTTPGVVTLAPTVVEYAAAPGDLVYLCTQVDIEGAGTFYWDDLTQEWSTSPGATCAFVYEPDPPDPFPGNAIDATVCPVFQALAPGVPGVIEIRPDGDVYVASTPFWDPFWDCPPYES